MGAPAHHPDLEAAHSPPRRLQLAGGLQGGLQDERPGRPPGQVPDPVLRLGASDLLVGVEEDDRRDRGRQVQGIQRPEREDELGEASLHVEDPRTPHAPVLDRHRHPVERPLGPDGVHVAQDQLERPVSLPVLGPGVQLPAGGLTGEDPHSVAHLLQGPSQEVEDVALGRGDRRRALRPDQLLQVADQLLAAGVEPLLDIPRLRMDHDRYRSKPAGKGKDRLSSIAAKRPGLR